MGGGGVKAGDVGGGVKAGRRGGEGEGAEILR